MLSILIPVYNFDVRSLVKDLHHQAGQCSTPFEIICLDDYSESEFRLLNCELKQLENVHYEELPANLGRSKIRNRLAEMAKYDYLLFLDCDAQTESQQFVANYLKAKNPEQVIYGGRTYAPKAPAEESKYFRWLYGTQREMIPVKVRQVHPYRTFLTNNFLLPKKIFLEIKMDPSLSGYGHEDTLFSSELKERNIRIRHIDNPLRHIGLEDAETFLQQTQNGLRNLNWLIEKGKIDKDNKLYAASRFFRIGLLRRYMLKWLKKNEKSIEANLTGPYPSLRKFDWYKLAWLIRIQDEKRQKSTNP